MSFTHSYDEYLLDWQKKSVQVPQKAGTLLTTRETINFSDSALYEVS